MLLPHPQVWCRADASSRELGAIIWRIALVQDRFHYVTLHRITSVWWDG